MIIKLSKTESIDHEAQLASIPPPAFRIETNLIPSWNDVLSVQRHFGMFDSLKKKWLKIGKELALDTAAEKGIALCEYSEHDLSPRGKPIVVHHRKFWTPFIHRACKIHIRVWRPDLREYDVNNPYLKPIIDGFVQCGLLASDSHEIVRSIECEFMGVDTSLKLSAEEKAARKAKRDAGDKKRMPLPARYWFDFYLLERTE
jgi:hypothetical protein